MLDKKEYELLYLINNGRTNLERLKDFDAKKELIKMLKKLEKNKLIKSEIRDNDIYGFMETSQGVTLLKSQQYAQWYEECGD